MSFCEGDAPTRVLLMPVDAPDRLRLARVLKPFGPVLVEAGDERAVGEALIDSHFDLAVLSLGSSAPRSLWRSLGSAVAQALPVVVIVDHIRDDFQRLYDEGASAVIARTLDEAHMFAVFHGIVAALHRG
jgi:hypothetical protein